MTVTAEVGTRVLEFDDDFIRNFLREPARVRHSLVGHPLLTLEAIAELADTMPLKFVERHHAHLPKLMPGGAPDVAGRPSDTVLGIEHNNCWMVLWYLEQVPEYAALLDEILDEVKAYSAREGGMRQREAFLFISAPDAVTPAHFDPEHNFLLQIRGTKDMNVCQFPDRAAAQRELDRYYDGGHRNLEVMPSEETNFRLAPGDGVYVPTFAPHWVQNHSEVSISLSITFRTPVSRQVERVNQVNAKLRKTTASPRAPGANAHVDRIKELAYIGLVGWKPRIGRLRRTISRHRKAGKLL
jgi:Cupin superfamily protein